MDGVILVDKPRGWTSHDVVAQIRDILSFKKIGHCGTLDPLATGLLVIAVGRATKLFSVLAGGEKAYTGRIRLGFSTDTYDSQGARTSPEIQVSLDVQRLGQALKEFEGEFLQTPPPYSAKKFRGKSLYRLAREKKPVPLTPCPVVVRRFNLTAYEPPVFYFEAECGPGTYIRSLAHDLGQKLGCGAHLDGLTRTRSGSFKLEEGLALEEIRRKAEKKLFLEFLIPLEDLFPKCPKVILRPEKAGSVRKGHPIRSEDIETILPGEPGLPPPCGEEPFSRLFSLEDRFLGLAGPGQKKGQETALVPFLLLK